MVRRILFLMTLVVIFAFSACKKEETNTAPTASFTITPGTGPVSTLFTFDASASSDADQAASELMVRWDWNNDGVWDTDYSTQKTAEHQYDAEGVYSVVLEVKDNEGLTGQTSKTLIVGEGDLNVETGDATDITVTEAKLKGKLLSVGEDAITDHGHCWSWFPEPDIQDSKTSLGPIAAPQEFTSNINGLTEEITYYFRAYATTANGTVYGNVASFTASGSGSGAPCPRGSTVEDADGNIYNTVLIDGKCWMKENLKVGQTISSTQNQADNGTIEKYCYNDDENYCEVFGGLYQWDELMQYSKDGRAQGICPDGWRLPTLDELKSLENAAGGGNEMTAVGATQSSTNTSGFSALMSGYKKYLPDEFADFGNGIHIWTSESYPLNQSQAYDMTIGSDGSIVYNTKNKQTASSVRCVKD